MGIEGLRFRSSISGVVSREWNVDVEEEGRKEGGKEGGLYRWMRESRGLGATSGRARAKVGEVVVMMMMIVTT